MKNIVLLLFDIVSYISDKVKREDKKQHLILHSGAGCFCVCGLTGARKMWYNLSGQTGI